MGLGAPEELELLLEDEELDEEELLEEELDDDEELELLDDELLEEELELLLEDEELEDDELLVCTVRMAALLVRLLPLLVAVMV